MTTTLSTELAMAGAFLCPERESNPHCAGFESAFSASWNTGAWCPSGESNPEPHGPKPCASASWARRAKNPNHKGAGG